MPEMEVSDEPIRVQAIAQNGQTHVPPQFIQPPENRPAVSPSPEPAATIPQIDLNGSPAETVAEVRRACEDWGAFHVINHGVPTQLLNEMKRVGFTFFQDCPMSEKVQYAGGVDSFATEGYGSRMLLTSDDAVLDWRDYFDHHTLPLSRRNPSNWPNFSPNYREVVVDYSNHMKTLAQRILSLISESLGLPSSRVEEAIGDLYQNITVSYYPACPQPELTLGLQAHSDMGFVTLLIQDEVGGLQVLKDGRWVDVYPSSEAIVVIIADQTEILTNGKYRSAEHRAVTNVSRPRLSVATFHDPARTRIMTPAPELTSETSPPRYYEFTYGDYVASWYTKGPEGKRHIDLLLK